MGPRLVVVNSGSDSAGGVQPFIISVIDVYGNLVVKGTPFLLFQSFSTTYNDWVLGGYTEAQADAMIQIMVDGGCNCLQSPLHNLYPYSNPAYIGMTNFQVIGRKFPQLNFNGDDGAASQNYASVAAFLARYKNNPQIILWCWGSEYQSLVGGIPKEGLPENQYIHAADPTRITCTEVSDGYWVGYGDSRSTYPFTVYYRGNDNAGGYNVFDELVHADGLSIYMAEVVQTSDIAGPNGSVWKYLLFFDRRRRGLNTSRPSSAPSVADGGAGNMSGTFQFLYTWVIGGDGTTKDPDAVESCASEISAPITIANRQVALSGIAAGPVGTRVRNIYAKKIGVSPNGRYLTSGYSLIDYIPDNTTTTDTVNLDYPFVTPVAAEPPPLKATLDWMGAISTTFAAEAGIDYNGIDSGLAGCLTLDACRRYYFLQAALNCRAFDSSTVWNQRGAGGNNDPVLGTLTQNSQIAFIAVAGDTGYCEFEGVLTDGVTVNRERIQLNGTTPVLTTQTYSKAKWVGAELGPATPVTVTQSVGGANLIIRNPVLSNPSSPYTTLPLRLWRAPSRGHGIYAPGPDGLPYGVYQIFLNTWTAISQVKTIQDVILAPGLWTRISATTPVFVPFDEATSGHQSKGIYAAKKSYGGFLWVIAVNVDVVQFQNVAPVCHGNLTIGSAIVTTITGPGSPATNGWPTGAPISGPGIPFGTTITTVDSGTQLTLSANATRTVVGGPFIVALEYTIPDPVRGVPSGVIDVGQPITTCVRVAGESGSPTFSGTQITGETFLPMAVHAYKIS